MPYTFSVGSEQHVFEVSDAAWRFFEACDHDQALNAQVTALKTMDEVAELGHARGFGTTYEDIVQYGTVAAIEQDARMQAGELTDDELDTVAGGAGTGIPPRMPCRATDCLKCCTSTSRGCMSCYCPRPCF